MQPFKGLFAFVYRHVWGLIKNNYWALVVPIVFNYLGSTESTESTEEQLPKCLTSLRIIYGKKFKVSGRPFVSC